MNLITQHKNMRPGEKTHHSFYEELKELRKRMEALESLAPTSEKASPQSESENNYKAEHGNSGLNIKSGMLYSLLIIAGVTMLLMTGYEVIKEFSFPHFTKWQSHTITIIFSSLIAPIGGYIALRKIEALRQRALKELSYRTKAEEKLKVYNDNLEVKVEERTKELVDTNSKLSDEVKVRKEAEEEIRKYAEELLISKDLLEKRATEMALLNKQLAASEAELKELNASKDKFFSILAHDLRSPFTSLLGLAEFMENEAEDLSPDELKLFASGITKSARGVYNLLENLLDWSRVQTGRIDFTPEFQNLYEIVENIANLNQVNMMKKNISFDNEIKQDIQVFADRNMIDTVFRNLVSNAIKFSHVGGNITIQNTQNEKYVTVTVKDTGVGIKENDIQKLFKIDEQITTIGTEEEKGTGLGLILCKEFIEKNNGTIWVESELGKGTSFHFTVPATPEAVDSNC